MFDKQSEFETALNKLARANSLMADGHDIDYACRQVHVDKGTLHEWANHFSLPENPATVLDECPISDAVLPIFATESANSPLEQIGSGVALALGQELFVLTSAHVTDHHDDEGVLYLPARDGIE